MTIEELTKRHTLAVLYRSKTKLLAARELGITIKTLYNWLHKWEIPDVVRNRDHSERLKAYHAAKRALTLPIGVRE